MKIRFDTLILYRISAVIISIPFVLSILTIDLKVIDVPPMVRRPIYWVGLLILWFAVAKDARAIYSGKRELRKRISEYASTNQADDNR